MRAAPVGNRRGTRRPRSSSRRHAGLGTRAVRACAAFIHGIVFSFGLVLTFVCGAMGSHLESQGIAPPKPWAAMGVLLRFLALPFIEVPLPDLTEAGSAGVDVMLWFPGLLGGFCLIFASLGFVSMRWRQTSRALPYALLAAVLLACMAEVAQASNEFSAWGDLASFSGRSRAMSEKAVLQQQVFRSGHGSFTQQFSEQRCKAVSGVQMIKCSATTMEANFMSLMVQGFCRPRSDDLTADFEKSANTCRGHVKSLMGVVLESDPLFCRCWTALFDHQRTLAWWILFIWFFMLAGILAVLYAASESRLNRMCARERFEVLVFAAISMTILACRAVLLPEGGSALSKPGE
mmetsp:Transcript_86432/g.257977  ORF Transcript_86432/g.257977 Transcript_86432/m.257977 type:complete len:348 (+) Transcript_86432:74-1117(+)